MAPFIAAVSGAVAIFLYWMYSRYRQKKQIRQQLAESWGKKKAIDHNWAQIRFYHDLVVNEQSGVVIDDDTWDDLNFDKLFKLIDRTESNIGQQVLFDMLRRPVQDAQTLEARERWIDIFGDEPDLRLDLQVELRKLTGFRIWRLSNLIFEALPQIPRWFYGFLVIPVLAVVSIVLGFLNPVFFVGLAILPVVNLAIQYVVGNRLARYTAALSALQPFLSAAERIAQIDEEHGSPLEDFGQQLRSYAKQLQTLKKRVSKFLYEGSPDNMGTLLWDYLNILFLLKINMFTLSVRALSQHKKILQQLYYKIGYLDAMISAASFKVDLDQYCKPTFQSEGRLNYQDVYHPLLDKPVPNSITVGRQGILVTGSNMSGKTTFLKTIGVNQILAQTFNFCCAAQADISFCNVISSMRRNDDLTEGKSFYLGEVERVKKLVDQAAQKDGSNLYLLDEIFRGTNTIERISASLEVLKWLNSSSDFVLASTHDLELVDLLDEEYEFYHFAEEVHDQTLTFDYKIKLGYSSTKNAIKLLGICNYPEEIVSGAMEVSKLLEQQGVINYSNPSDSK